ncbi:CLUMA_CG016054, isoform A [Clunio marinus]|uniref:CLUMA_CG016054, isoform A n=1 Tax=Clunio marinus TaxID=568069 RepID=A0A1J1IQT8_9DIPT|nr:CLUMA_CG016054, isoform A [Clunio marinus]
MECFSTHVLKPRKESKRKTFYSDHQKNFHHVKQENKCLWDCDCEDLRQMTTMKKSFRQLSTALKRFQLIFHHIDFVPAKVRLPVMLSDSMGLSLACQETTTEDQKRTRASDID